MKFLIQIPKKIPNFSFSFNNIFVYCNICSFVIYVYLAQPKNKYSSVIESLRKQIDATNASLESLIEKKASIENKSLISHSKKKQSLDK